MKRILQYFITVLLYGLAAIPAQAQFGSSDMGQASVSTLAWQDISSDVEGGGNGETIGLTTDGRVYMWGENRYFNINANQNVNKLSLYQTVPYYKPMPEVITKVKIMWASNNQSAAASYPNNIYTYFALGQSGKLYVWGVNTGLFGSSWPGASIPSLTDTTKVSRTPTQLTVPGESAIIDFTARNGTLVVIGASGKAYVLGYYTFNQIATTFKTLPNPAGVGSSFKYTKLWGTLSDYYNLYLKGNDGSIYLTYSHMYSLATGVPSLFNVLGSAGFGHGPSQDPTASTSNPVLVPFPAGEDIIHIEYDRNPGPGNYKDGYCNRTFAISASGKGFMTGQWRANNGNGEATSVFVFCPLKQEPVASDIYNYIPFNNNKDTTVYVKRFVEVAMPPGATGILGLYDVGIGQPGATMIIGNNHKVYWSGRGWRDNGFEYGNYFADSYYIANPPPKTDRCEYNIPITSSRYQWSFEAINYRGAARIITDVNLNNYGYFIISGSGRGYYVGDRQGWARTGLGKLSQGYDAPFPTPIASEQLLSCQTSAGTGGPLGEPVSTPAAGVIDCSKTKLYPAPVQGTPSELSLLVTINVTTIGDFSPITISGSGMSLVSGFDKVSATTTGVQAFHIPIKYDGSTLTNAFQFTIGQAGSCSADLTNKPSNEITKVWSLNNCTAITPGSLSK